MTDTDNDKKRSYIFLLSYGWTNLTKQLTMKTIISIFLTVATVIGLVCWLIYYLALRDQEKKWYKSEYLDKEFDGIIIEIGDYSYNSTFQKEFISLTILTKDRNQPEIHYGMLSFKKEPLLKTFILKGDSVYKNKGEKKMTFKKPNGQVKQFELPIDI